MLTKEESRYSFNICTALVPLLVMVYLGFAAIRPFVTYPSISTYIDSMALPPSILSLILNLTSVIEYVIVVLVLVLLTVDNIIKPILIKSNKYYIKMSVTNSKSINNRFKTAFLSNCLSDDYRQYPKEVTPFQVYLVPAICYWQNAVFYLLFGLGLTSPISAIVLKDLYRQSLLTDTNALLCFTLFAGALLLFVAGFVSYLILGFFTVYNTCKVILPLVKKGYRIITNLKLIKKVCSMLSFEFTLSSKL